MNDDGEVIPFELFDIDGSYLLRSETPRFGNNPLAGEYQQYVGGTHHATEMLNFNGDMAELLDARQAVAYPAISWIKIAKWLPWMQMGDRAGLLYFNTMGKKLKTVDELSATMKEQIEKNYPQYLAPPPADDPRSNETPLMYIKKMIDQRHSKQNQTEGHDEE